MALVSHKLPNVAKAGVIMMLSLLLSRVLGIVRDMIMAWKFGQGAETDAYVLSFQLPDLLFFLIAGGALSSAFIPVFSEFLHTGRERQAWKLFSVVVTVMSIAVTAFVVIAFIFAEPMMRLFAPNAPAEQLPLIAQMSRILLPAQFAFFIGGIMFGTLYSRQVFSVPGLAPNIYNLGIIFGALVLSNFVVPGVMGMSWGALIGASIGNLVIPLFALRKLGADFRPSLDIKDEAVRKVFRLMLPVILGLSLPGVYAMIMRGFGTAYEAGIVTALDYSNKLMQAPLGVFGQSLAIAVFPALTQFFAQDRMDQYRLQLAATLRTVLYITLPISALMFVLSPQIVQLAFERGKFTHLDTLETADCLRMFSLGIFAWCLHPVLMRGFFSIQSTRTPIILGTVTTALFVGLVLVLRETSLGYRALPLASSIAATVMVVMLMLAIRRQAGGLDLESVALTFMRGSIAAVLAASAVYGGLLLWPQEFTSGTFPLVFQVFGLGLLGAWMYYGLTRLMKMPETTTVNRVLGRMSRSRQDDQDIS